MWWVTGIVPIHGTVLVDVWLTALWESNNRIINMKETIIINYINELIRLLSVVTCQSLAASVMTLICLLLMAH